MMMMIMTLPLPQAEEKGEQEWVGERECREEAGERECREEAGERECRAEAGELGHWKNNALRLATAEYDPPCN